MEERIFIPKYSLLYWCKNAFSFLYPFFCIINLVEYKMGTDWFLFWALMTAFATIFSLRELAALHRLRRVVFSDTIQFVYRNNDIISQPLGDPVIIDHTLIKFKHCEVNLEDFQNMRGFSEIVNAYAAQGYLELKKAPKAKKQRNRVQTLLIFMIIGISLVIIAFTFGIYFIMKGLPAHLIGPATDTELVVVIFSAIAFTVIKFVVKRRKATNAVQHTEQEQK